MWSMQRPNAVRENRRGHEREGGNLQEYKINKQAVKCEQRNWLREVMAERTRRARQRKWWA